MGYDLRYFVLGLINWLIRPQLSLLFLSSTYQDNSNSSSITLLPRLTLLSLFFLLFLFTSFKLAPQSSFVVVRCRHHHHHQHHGRRHLRRGGAFHGCATSDHFNLILDGPHHHQVGIATGGDHHVHYDVQGNNNNNNNNNNNSNINSNDDEDHIVPATGGDNLSSELRRRVHHASSEVSSAAGGDDDQSGEARRRSHYDSEGTQSSSELRHDWEVVGGGEDGGGGNYLRRFWVEFGYEQSSVLVITALSLSLLCSTPVFQCIHPWIILASLCPSFSRKFLGQLFHRFGAAFSAFIIISPNAIDFPTQTQGGDSMV